MIKLHTSHPAWSNLIQTPVVCRVFGRVTVVALYGTGQGGKRQGQGQTVDNDEITRPFN